MQDLVAPRPLRLAAMPSFAFYSSHTSSPSSYIRPRQSSVRLRSSPSAEAFARISISDGSDAERGNDKDRSPLAIDDVDVPPSTSPRLSPEALEEFLSILQPVIMKNPDSPIIRPRFDRPYSWGHKRNRSSSSDEYRSISEQSLHSQSGEELDQVSDEIKYDNRHWHYSSVLSLSASPISRTHTQNPLARCVSQDIDISSYLVRAVSPRISTPSILALAQSIPIPSSPFPSSRGPSPRTVEV